MKKKIVIILLLFFYTSSFLSAEENIDDINKISKNLRCVVCQGQSIYDSQSDFALSVKILIKKKLDEGHSEQNIYDYLKAKYGEWIVYEPELKKNTYLLWILPLILFVFGGLLIIKKAYIKDGKNK